jgi:hypothetical protein
MINNMKTTGCFLRLSILIAQIVFCFAVSILAQDLSIPGSGLTGAIRVAQQKPTGPLTVQNMVKLINFMADSILGPPVAKSPPAMVLKCYLRILEFPIILLR